MPRTMNPTTYELLRAAKDSQRVEALTVALGGWRLAGCPDAPLTYEEQAAKIESLEQSLSSTRVALSSAHRVLGEAGAQQEELKQLRVVFTQLGYDVVPCKKCGKLRASKGYFCAHCGDDE